MPSVFVIQPLSDLCCLRNNGGGEEGGGGGVQHLEELSTENYLFQAYTLTFHSDIENFICLCDI